MQDLLTVMRRLRGPGGCPWDQEQTHESLRPYLLEEAAEAVDAVDDPDRLELAAELGDVLLQVAFHAVIAEEQGSFRYADIEAAIVDKLIRRHPHVFGETQVSGSAEVVENWQTIKAGERGGRPRRAAEQVPAALGALAREAQAQKLAGLRGDRAGLEALLASAPDSEEGVARVLGAAVAWARALDIDPELALRRHAQATLTELDRAAGG